jgi:hypothetical protein
MNKLNLVLGAAVLTVGVFVGLPQTVFAYKGDPTVQGPNYTAERHAAVTKAFANKDYNAWKAQMEGRGIARRITAANFARFAEAHQLALAGKTAEADAIRAELGLGQKNGSGMGQGTGRGNCQGRANQ